MDSPPVTLDNAADLWTAVSDELALQLDQNVFNLWLAGSRGLSLEQETLFVQVTNGRAVGWLARYQNQIDATVRSVSNGSATAVEFEPPAPAVQDWSLSAMQQIVNQTKAVEPEPETENLYQPPEPAAGQVRITQYRSDPTKAFYQLSHYASRYWRPLLGPTAFALWEILNSYAYFVSKGMEEWPTIEMLAQTIGRGTRHSILGRAETESRPRQIGAVEVLENARILHSVTEGEGNRTRYHFVILEDLPLLTPFQVRALPQSIQDSHLNYLGHFKGYNVEAWHSITAETLIADGWWN